MTKKKVQPAPAAAPAPAANNQPLSLEESAALIEVDRKNRINACAAAIQEALEKYKCELDIAMVVRTDRSEPQLTVISKQ